MTEKRDFRLGLASSNSHFLVPLGASCLFLNAFAKSQVTNGEHCMSKARYHDCCEVPRIPTMMIKSILSRKPPV